MESELEELESLFSAHFGRTPSASQQSESQASTFMYTDSGESDQDETDHVGPDVEVRTRSYFDSLEGEDTGVGGITVLEEDPDMIKIREFKDAGCGCMKMCSTKLKQEDIYAHILNIREMEKTEKEMYIMATIVDNDDKEMTKRGKKRKSHRQAFYYQGKQICKKTFKIVFDIGKHSLNSIIQHVQENGVTPRKHGNTGKRPIHSLMFDDVRTVIQFITNYSDEFGMPQPAAPRGTDNSAPIYLTSDTTKQHVHERYLASCDEANLRSVKYSTFNNIWRSSLSHIKIATPRDDVCAQCEKLRKCQMDARTEEEKMIASNAMRDHIMSAQRERDVYNTCIQRSRENNCIHYTFDFSQNVCLPHHARQMGPLYFLSARKVQIFGFRIDGIPRQLNFLVDEHQTIGADGTATHGPNAVISMIDWALTNHNSGETRCSIHADNCAGQNKNKFVIGYFLWRVMTGRHEQIEYMMQIPGHARCLVDSGFAFLKKLYRRTDCDSIDQLVEVVNKSSSTNEAVCYPAWQWRDWKAFLEPVFQPLQGIRKYQYFRMVSTEPGVVIIKRHRDAEEERINLLKDKQFTFNDEQPNIIPPAGMSEARQQYLYRNVRQHVRPRYQDVTCPQPRN